MQGRGEGVVPPEQSTSSSSSSGSSSSTSSRTSTSTRTSTNTTTKKKNQKHPRAVPRLPYAQQRSNLQTLQSAHKSESRALPLRARFNLQATRISHQPNFKARLYVPQDSRSSASKIGSSSWLAKKASFRGSVVGRGPLVAVVVAVVVEEEW